jgi:hypothetical protein
VFDLSPQACRDGIQYLSQIKVGDNRIIDFEQNSCPIEGQESGSMASDCRITRAFQALLPKLKKLTSGEGFSACQNMSRMQAGPPSVRDVSS